MTVTSPFKAYDIRGKVGSQIDANFAFRLGRAVALQLAPGSFVVGSDIRESSPALAAALAQGLAAEGTNVHDLGLCGNEEVYFATDHLGAGAGVMVTASHNLAQYNGFKLIGPEARPLPDADFRAIQALVDAPPPPCQIHPGRILPTDTRAAYVDRVLSFIDSASLAPLRIFANSGNGAAGRTFDAIAAALQTRGATLDIHRVHHAPDGRFPNGVPNPLLPKNHAATGDPVRATQSALGIAWDGDFDRCFLFDETGAFVPGEYIVAVLAQAMLDCDDPGPIVHDPRVVWNTRRIVTAHGGRAIASPVGHVFMKDRMRRARMRPTAARFQPTTTSAVSCFATAA